MAVYDLEEQEQLDELKSWWRQYRGLISLVLIALALSYSAFQGWRYYQDKQALDASELYSQLQTAVGAGDKKKVQDIAAAMADQYPRATYSAFAALAAARAAFDTGATADAAARLQWVIDHAKDDLLRDIAQLRLAGVLLDEKKYDQALRLLDAKHGEAMTALYADLKGDLLVAQGKDGEARGAYQLALDKSDAKSSYRALIQMKLDGLGAAK
jgi:predicted negative regulator of RcsB-dependent stress response